MVERLSPEALTPEAIREHSFPSPLLHPKQYLSEIALYSAQFERPYTPTWPFHDQARPPHSQREIPAILTPRGILKRAIQRERAYEQLSINKVHRGEE
jgi:hypothetical protein